METRASYIVVGLFTVVLGVGLVAMGLWVAGDLAERAPRDTYVVYLEESVAGLRRGAPVRFQGVDVGRVRDMGFDEARPGTVRLLIEVDRAAPVSEATVATLRTVGLTGVNYLELEGHEPDAPRLVPEAGRDHPEIATAPSLQRRLEAALDEGVATLRAVGEGLEALLDEPNREAFARVLEHSAAVTRTLAAHRDDLGEAIAGGARLTEEGERTLGALTARLTELEGTLAAAEELLDTLQGAGRELEAAAAEGRHGMEAFTAATLPQVNALLLELNHTARRLGRLAEELEEQPRLLLFGREPRPPGPGEE